MRRDRGFTLIELMIVMSLDRHPGQHLAHVVWQQRHSREGATLKEDLFRMRDAIDQYYADKNRYPSSLEELVSDKYLRSVPIDPFTQSADTWQTTTSDADPSNPSAEPGISDVKSGSDRTALDGSPYSGWE
jgi:general secretion pathway protein G